MSDGKGWGPEAQKAAAKAPAAKASPPKAAEAVRPAAAPAPVSAPVLTVTRSPLVFLVLGGIALAALVANIAGSQYFPPNAPVEGIVCFGIIVDMVAVVILSIVGFLVARRPITVRPSSPLSVVGLVLGAVSLAITIAASWIPGLMVLLDGLRLHYTDETFIVFILAPVWITGLAFSAFAYRRGGQARNNLFCLLGLAFGVAVFVGAAVAAVLYGLDLTT